MTRSNQNKPVRQVWYPAIAKLFTSRKVTTQINDKFNTTHTQLVDMSHRITSLVQSQNDTIDTMNNDVVPLVIHIQMYWCHRIKHDLILVRIKYRRICQHW